MDRGNPFLWTYPDSQGVTQREGSEDGKTGILAIHPGKNERLEARKIPWKRRSIDTNQQFLDLRYTYVHAYSMFTYIYLPTVTWI